MTAGQLLREIGQFDPRLEIAVNSQGALMIGQDHLIRLPKQIEKDITEDYQRNCGVNVG